MRSVARRALVLDVGDALAAPDGALVAVSGVAVAAPETRSPYSQQPCAWAHGSTVRHWREREFSSSYSDRDGDGFYDDREIVEKSEVIHEARSGRSFALKSTVAGQREVWVDAGGASGDRLEKLSEQTTRTVPPWLAGESAGPDLSDLSGPMGAVIGVIAQSAMMDRDLRFEVTEHGVRDGEVITVMGTITTVRKQRVIGPGEHGDVTLDSADDPRRVIRRARVEGYLSAGLLAAAIAAVAFTVLGM